jgi:hypothetical protein
MKKEMLISLAILVIVFCGYLVDCYLTIESNATYYTAEYPEDQDAPDKVLDIEFDVHPSIVKTIYLKELTLNKGCELESPNGSNVESVERKLTVKRNMYSVIKSKDKTILRFEDSVLPYIYRHCYNLYSGEIEIVFETDRRSLVKKFNIREEKRVHTWPKHLKQFKID